MKYTNPFVKLKHKGGAESELGNMVADLDKFINFYFEATDGFSLFPEEIVSLWRFIDYDSAFRKVGFAQSVNGITELSRLNELVIGLRKMTGQQLYEFDSVGSVNQAKLVMLTLDADHYIEDIGYFMHPETSKVFNDLREEILAALSNGSEVDQGSLTKISVISTHFYEDLRHLTGSHKRILDLLPYFSDAFKGKKARLLNGSLDIRLIRRTIKNKLGADFKEYLIPISVIVDKVLSDEISDSNMQSPRDVGIDFEEVVSDLYKRLGYSITLTPSVGDFGIDLIAKSNNKALAIQCKNYEGSVGVDAVMQAYSGAKYYDCSGSVVVSRAGFTSAAYEMAEKLDVELLVLG